MRTSWLLILTCHEISCCKYELLMSAKNRWLYNSVAMEMFVVFNIPSFCSLESFASHLFSRFCSFEHNQETRAFARSALSECHFLPCWKTSFSQLGSNCSFSLAINLQCFQTDIKWAKPHSKGLIQSNIMSVERLKNFLPALPPDLSQETPSDLVKVVSWIFYLSVVHLMFAAQSWETNMAVPILNLTHLLRVLWKSVPFAPDNKTYNKQSQFPTLVSSKNSPTEQKPWLWQKKPLKRIVFCSASINWTKRTI